MSEILVTYSAMHAAQGDVKAAAANLNSQLSDLKSYLAPMVATWEDDASRAFDAKQKQWDAAAADLTQVLEQIGTALGLAADDYKDGERANAGIWV